MGMMIDLLLSLMCWCGMFITIAVQADIVLTLVLCWGSGCFAGLFIRRK